MSGWRKQYRSAVRKGFKGTYDDWHAKRIAAMKAGHARGKRHRGITEGSKPGQVQFNSRNAVERVSAAARLDHGMTATEAAQQTEYLEPVMMNMDGPKMDVDSIDVATGKITHHPAEPAYDSSRVDALLVSISKLDDREAIDLCNRISTIRAATDATIQ